MAGLPDLESPPDAANLVLHEMGLLDQEQLRVLFSCRRLV